MSKTKRKFQRNGLSDPTRFLYTSLPPWKKKYEILFSKKLYENFVCHWVTQKQREENVMSTVSCNGVKVYIALERKISNFQLHWLDEMAFSNSLIRFRSRLVNNSHEVELLMYVRHIDSFNNKRAQIPAVVVIIEGRITITKFETIEENSTSMFQFRFKYLSERLNHNINKLRILARTGDSIFIALCWVKVENWSENMIITNYKTISKHIPQTKNTKTKNSAT